MSAEWTRDGRVPLTKDELTVQIEALREYRLRLNITDARQVIADALIFRLGRRLKETETQL